MVIKDQFIETYNPQQNPVELRAIKYLKEHSHVLLDHTGAPESCWFLAIKYLADILNICADPSLNDQVPLTVRTGVTKDISAFLQFQFWQQVLYLDHEETWPASRERTGRWVGVTDNVGDMLTYWILDEQSKQLLAQSVVCPLHSNHCVKFDPSLNKHLKRTASNGGTYGLPSNLIQNQIQISMLTMKKSLSHINSTL